MIYYFCSQADNVKDEDVSILFTCSTDLYLYIFSKQLNSRVNLLLRRCQKGILGRDSLETEWIEGKMPKLKGAICKDLVCNVKKNKVK